MKKLFISMLLLIGLYSCRCPQPPCAEQSHELNLKIEECNSKKLQTKCCWRARDTLNICPLFDNENDKSVDDVEKYGESKQEKCIENIRKLSCEGLNELGNTPEEIVNSGITHCFDFKKKK